MTQKSDPYNKLFNSLSSKTRMFNVTIFKYYLQKFIDLYYW